MIFWQFRDDFKAFCLKIDAAAELLSAVGDAEKRHLQYEVVAACLVDDSLCKGHCLFLTLHNDEGFHFVVVNDDVASLRHAVEGDCPFDLH